MGNKAASKMDVKQGTSADAWSAALDFDFATWFLLAESWTNLIDIQVSYDGTTWQDTFKIDPDRPLLLLFCAKSIRVKSNQAGAAADYQAAGVD